MERYYIEDIADAFINGDQEKLKRIDIWFNKQFNEYKYKAFQMGNLSHCRLCGNRLSGKANSHSVPQMILKNIETNGEYCQITCAIDQGIKMGPFGRVNRLGLNNAGTFRLICHKCDQQYFADYEKPDYLEQVAIAGKDTLADKILAEIYLKSTLLEKYKKEFNKNLAVLMNEKCDNEGIPQNIATISDELSVKEYDELIDTCKDIIENDLHNNFCIFYFDVLDYSSNIAAQALFPIQKTPAGGIINDVFNLDPRYRIVLTEMVVFPLKEKTVCLGFCLKRDKERMQPFIGYMNRLPITAKRKLFQSTLMAYTEEIYTNQETINQIIQDKTTMSFILSALESGKTSASDLERGYIVKKPELVSTKGFRKVVFHI